MNIDISKYIEFLKSYMSLLVPGVIALFGVGFFVPTHFMSSKLQSTIKKESISQGTTVRSLESSTVSSVQWYVERVYQENHGNDANMIERLARQTTMRLLLSYDVFPEPKEESVMIVPSFGIQFCSGIREMLSGVHGGRCPSQEEINNATKNLSTPYRRGIGARGVMGSVSKVRGTIEEGLCMEKAQVCRVYANPAYLSGYNFWQNYDYSEADSGKEAIRVCWYSQLAYWVIDDVLQTIGELNKDSQTVLMSPVKRLASVSFSRMGINWKISNPVPVRRSSTKKSYADKASYVLSAKDMLVRSFTKRVSNDLHDVVHFKTTVVLSADSVLAFMKELCSSKSHTFRGWDGSGPVEDFEHNQITILECKTSPVDRLASEHKWYRYGEDAVVELELTCEYLLDKVAYDSVKPSAVKTEVSQKIEAATKKSSGKTRRASRAVRPKRKPR